MIICEVFLKDSNFIQFSYIQPFHHAFDSFYLYVRWIEKTLQKLCKVFAKFLKTSQIIISPFDELKKLLTTNTVMGYFDPLKQTELYVDASSVGLGAILSQTTPGDNDRTILAYASRSLTDVETRYSQIEREALGIVYGVEHFRLYLFGREFTLTTDHKPLELIYQNPKSHSSARLECLCLRLRDYQFTVRYRPGPENPADYLSRHPLPSDSTDTFVEEYVNFVGSSAIPVAMDIDEIRNATRSDPTLQQLIEIILLELTTGTS